MGNALDLAKDPHLLPTFNKWAKQYGPIVSISVFGQKMVIVSDEEIANDLFAKRGNIYSDRGTPPALAVVSDGVQPALIDKTDVWRRQRVLRVGGARMRYEPFSRQMEGQAWAMRPEGMWKGMVEIVRLEGSGRSATAATVWYEMDVLKRTDGFSLGSFEL